VACPPSSMRGGQPARSYGMAFYNVHRGGYLWLTSDSNGAVPAPEGQHDRAGVDPVPQPLVEPHAPTVLTPAAGRRCRAPHFPVMARGGGSGRLRVILGQAGQGPQARGASSQSFSAHVRTPNPGSDNQCRRRLVLAGVVHRAVQPRVTWPPGALPAR
jgi:hypothetical protein